MESPSEILHELTQRVLERTDPANELELIVRLAAFFPVVPFPFLGKTRHKDWPKVCAANIDRFPACIACGTTVRKFLTCHHIKPYNEFPELELVDKNLATMCETPSHNCHFIFGHLCWWNISNPRVLEMSADYLEEYVRQRAKIELVGV